MITAHTVASLQAFTAEIASLFNEGKIRAPIHLDGGNEQNLLDVFQTIGPEDWVCGSWRMQLKCLLKGVPEDELRQAILDGRSITLCFPNQRVVSSAIVGGILPIALGLAWSIKRRGGAEKVHCFLGDMTATTGIAYECGEYAASSGLPIRWIIEDNGKSVMTPTAEAWNFDPKAEAQRDYTAYIYDLPWPHSGAGQRVNF